MKKEREKKEKKRKGWRDGERKTCYYGLTDKIKDKIPSVHINQA